MRIQRKDSERQAQAGFTLIELIAVLVILGILAAVAVPKFTELQADARVKALDGAYAAGMSQVNLAYAQFILTNNGAVPTAMGTNQITGGAGTTPVSVNTTLGDFTVAYAAGTDADTYKITVSAGPTWVGSVDAADKVKDNIPAPW